MQRFESIEELVAYMFRRVHSDEIVSVIADKDLSVAVMKELLNHDKATLSLADVDEYEYDKEYLVSLEEDEDKDRYHVAIEQIYNYDKDMYFGIDGHILFHEDVNSKALIDMKKNGFIESSGYDWFVIGEGEENANGNGCSHVNNASCSCPKDTECSDDENLHGFTATKPDGNSYMSFSIHTTDKISKDDIQSFLKAIGF